MAFDGFGGAGGHLAQQLEAARSTGTVYFSPDSGSSLSVSLLPHTILVLSLQVFMVVMALSK